MGLDVKLTFNGYDFAPLLSTYAVDYEISYRKVVTALDGTEYFGNGTRRPIINFTLRPLTDSQSKAAYDALKIMVASCSYTDPAVNGSADASVTRTAQFRVTSSLEAAFGLRSVDGNRYYKGGVITLRGVTCLA